jgi:hypothetical protein
MANDNIFKIYCKDFGCRTLPEFYSNLEWIAKVRMGLNHMPFMLSELEAGIQSFLFFSI